jgi:hypothetical protein
MTSLKDRFNALEAAIRGYDRQKAEISFSPNSKKLRELVDRGSLRKTYGDKKSIAGKFLNAGIEIHGELPPHVILNLLPESVLDTFLASDLVFDYDNGLSESEYNARENHIGIKRSNDVIHEAGHALWYILIPKDEAHKKKVLIDSLPEHEEDVNILSPRSIPTFHMIYGRLMGAYSGQLLKKGYFGQNKYNYLEELFARNFNFLMLGKPLEALPESRAPIQMMLDWYKMHEMVDDDFVRFYNRSIDKNYGGIAVRRVPIDEMTVGSKITYELMKRIAIDKRVVMNK